MVSSEIIEGLRTSELFSLLSEEELRTLTSSLAAACEAKTYEAGDRIFEQGEHSARLYIITDGQVLLQRSVNIGGRTAMWPRSPIMKPLKLVSTPQAVRSKTVVP